MSVQDKVRAIHGIENYLRKFKIDVNINKDKHINQIFLDFAKSMNWEHEFVKQNKPNYKGSNKPSWSNALLIQANFKDFTNYITKNYEK
jgi:hypothetical protein